jgi:hypothetical protein
MTRLVGERNGMWKKDEVGYAPLHQWIKRHYGKATHCSVDKSHNSKRFEWANISGEYKRYINDFRQLCVSCHRKVDMTDQKREKIRQATIGNTSHNIPIVSVDNLGVVTVYKSARIAQEKTGVSHKCISNCLKGLSKTAGGLTWNYHLVK